MDDFPALRNSVRSRCGALYLPLFHISAARGMHDFAKSLLHVMRHLHLVLAPFPVEAQHGDPKLIHYLRINFAIAVRIGNHFAAPCKPDAGAIGLPTLALERRTISLEVIANIVKFSNARQIASAAKLDGISAHKLVLAIDLPPRHVKVHATNSINIVWRHGFESGE